MKETTVAIAVVCVLAVATAFIWSLAYMAFQDRPAIVCKTLDLSLEGKVKECHLENSKVEWFKGKPTKADLENKGKK